MIRNAARDTEAIVTRADEPAVLDAARRPVVAPARYEGAHLPASELAALAPKRSFSRLRADAARLCRVLAASTCVMVAWSLFEVPWEIDLTSGREQTATVVASKTMLLVIATLSLRGRRWLPAAVRLPDKRVRHRAGVAGGVRHVSWLAFLSSVECGAKLAVVVLLALYLPRDRRRSPSTNSTDTRSRCFWTIPNPPRAGFS